jgi:lysophospholipase L1-like esterase
MCANPATENPAIYCLTQQIVRSAIDKVAKENNHDFIDNYSIFKGLPLGTFTADNLHPNATGMRMIADNIISALEQA